MSDVIDYKIVMGGSPDALAEQVNRLLLNNWELYGTPFTRWENQICQAMIAKRGD